ncbi:MAG TPA: HAMP domain-containing sensor histidine kinase [Patescibacteria group bacterium]|nr:HAMP domain-containing sensor histidine kinase [Patescibacteria group bacterium]
MFVTKLPNTLRAKLTIWYGLSAVFLVITTVVLFGVLLWRVVHDQIDHHIHIVVAEAKHIVETYLGPERERLLRNLVSEKGMTVTLLSPDGTAIVQTNSPDIAVVTEHQLQKIAMSTDRQTDVPSHFTEGGLRFASTPVFVGGGYGAIAVGYSLFVEEQIFRIVASIFFVVMLGILVPLLFFMKNMLARELFPLEEIANTVSKIADHQDFSTRLSISTEASEFRIIADAFNSMIASLERAFTSERAFFSDAAHTLKTPLAVIHAKTQELPSSLQSAKKIILSSVEHAAGTVQDLLLLSKVERGVPTTFQRVNLSSLMQDIVDITKTLVQQKQVRVRSSLSQHIEVLGDESQLRRAILNVIQNAVTHTKKSGRITVLLSKTYEPRMSALLVVRDTGHGISKQDVSHVFERFYRGKHHDRISGSGLGLAITKAVIEQCKGSIFLSSTKGKGTTVRIVIPRVS